MDTARASKLAAVLAGLMLIAVMAALTAARGSLGFADWPAVSKAPVPEETVVIVGDDAPVAPSRAVDELETVSEPLPGPAGLPAPATALTDVEVAPEPPAERVEPAVDPDPGSGEREGAEAEGPEAVDKPVPAVPVPAVSVPGVPVTAVPRGACHRGACHRGAGPRGACHRGAVPAVPEPEVLAAPATETRDSSRGHLELARPGEDRAGGPELPLPLAPAPHEG